VRLPISIGDGLLLVALSDLDAPPPIPRDVERRPTDQSGPTCRKDIIILVSDTMKRSLLSAMALSLSATILLAASATPTFRKNTPYAVARATLLSRGWVPVKAVESDCEPGREDVCAAYPEAQSCAGTGFGLCTFRFRSLSGSLIEIVTHGGNVGQLTVSDVVECSKTGCD